MPVSKCLTVPVCAKRLRKLKCSVCPGSSCVFHKLHCFYISVQDEYNTYFHNAVLMLSRQKTHQGKPLREEKFR